MKTRTMTILAAFPCILLGLVATMRWEGGNAPATTRAATQAAVALAPLIGLVVNRPKIDEGVFAVLGITAFFSLLFVVSGLLFRNAAQDANAAVVDRGASPT